MERTMREMAESGNYPHVAYSRGLWRLIEPDTGKQIGPNFWYVSDAVDWRTQHARTSPALPVEQTG